MKLFCRHKYEIKSVDITIDNDIANQIFSKVNSKIYEKFTIAFGNTYKICLKCGKIK